MFLEFQIILIIIAAFFATILYRKSIKKQKIYLILLLICSGIIYFFKDFTIPDYEVYYKAYSNIEIGKWYGFNIFSKVSPVYPFEYGFFYILYFFKCIIGNRPEWSYMIIYVVSIFINIEGIYKIIGCFRNENSINDNIPLIYVVFMSYYGLCYCGIALRVGITIGLAYWLFYFWLKKKYIFVVIIGICSFLIQRMVIVSILAIALYFLLPQIKRQKQIIIWGVIGALMATNFSNRYISLTYGFISLVLKRLNVMSYMSYLMNISANTAVRKVNIWLWLLGILFLFCLRENQSNQKMNNIYLTGMTIALLSNNIPGGTRIQDCILFFEVLLLYRFYKEGLFFKIRIRKMILIFISIINIVVSYSIYHL